MGLLRTTPGPVLDRQQIAEQMIEIFSEFRPWGLVYDRAKIFEVVMTLNGAGWEGKRFTTTQRSPSSTRGPGFS